MADRVTPERRSYIMSRVGQKHTGPEMALRRALHRLGYRYRLHRRDLPGSPDIVFPSRRKAVFVHGCFWHGHDCPMFKLPVTRQEFWMAKISSNRTRDARATAALLELGWRVANVWECTLRGPGRLTGDEAITRCQTFLLSEKITLLDISGTAKTDEEKQQ